MIYAFPHFEKLMAFILERHRIWRKRQHGQKAPWTKDEILAKYRFCNVYREYDRVTTWIRLCWRNPHEDDEDLWFAMVVARLINHPETLKEFALPGRWNKAQFLKVMKRRKASGEKVFGSAYIVSTNGIAQDKAIYLANAVLDPMWERREKLRPKPKDTLRAYHLRLMDEQGMGSFMAAQVVADIKFVKPLCYAKDFWTFAASGPGSRRGMAYLMGLDPRMQWKEHEWREALAELQTLVDPHVSHHGMPRISAQDLQNCLCEFSKYRRTQLGTGRPKQKFVPNPEAF